MKQQSTVDACCAKCGDMVAGKFCTNCGTSRNDGQCAACKEPMAQSDRFCTHCGATAGTQATATGLPNGLITGFAAGAILVTMVFLVLGLLERATTSATPTPVQAATSTSQAPAPDISDMTPREQFGRLADRIQASLENDDTAKVIELFPMLQGAFGNLLPGDRDLDARFHMGLLLAEAQQLDEAAMQADSIQLEMPNDLFGHYLRATIAKFRGDSVAVRLARQKFRADFDSQMATGREDYQAHKPLLDQFLDQIKAN